MQHRKAALHLLPILAIFLLPACLGTQPKNFPFPTPNFNNANTGLQNTFLFNFAFRDSTVTTAPFTIYLQASTSAASSAAGLCNLAGTACICEFQDANGNVLGSTNSTQISYDQTGNYFSCTQTAAVSATPAAQVRIHNIANTISSLVLPVDTSSTLTLQKIVGSDLSVNNVRSVFNYSCNFTFLQKAGTTTTFFDCSNQSTQCNGDNFCLVEARFPFYLYSDNFTNNFSLKIAEKLYNDTSTGTICGLQIPQYECADAQGTPLKAFGLYNTQTGIWNTSVQLGPGPNQATATYGFAAQVSPTSNLCPPGLVKQVFYQINPVNSAAAPNSNMPANLVATQVSSPTATPAGMAINQIPGGHCNGTSCSLPAVGTLTVLTQAYSSTGQTAFCVIPSTLLP
jgi:hypothetical protein